MTLITAFILKMIRRCFKLGQPFSCHPYEWDEGSSLPMWTRSKFKLAVWSLNVLLTGAQFVFIVVRTIQVNLDLDGSSVGGGIMQKIYMQFMMICFTFPVLFQLTFLTRRGKLVGFIKGYMKFYIVFDGKFFLRENKR